MMRKPKIRFKGYNEDWEQRKLGEVLIERNVQHPQNAEFPLVSFTVENGVTPKTDSYEREQLIRGDKKGKKYKETRRDDIVYNPANLKFGAIARNKYGNAVFSPIYVTYEVDKSTIFPSFVEMFVTRDSFIQNALQYQQGTVYERMSVNTSDFEKLDIAIPSLAEQKEIGEYFSTLDHLITLHHRKCVVLRKKKVNDWEQRKLGELVGIYDGVHQTPDYQDSGIMFLSVENIATLKSEKYISEEAFERDYKVYPEKGDILMTRIGDVGTTNVVEIAEKVAFYVSLALLKPNGIDSYFLSNAMKTNPFLKGLRERTLVTAIPQKINKDEIGKIDIFITNNDEEQKKIGAYFHHLDHLITLHHHEEFCTENVLIYIEINITIQIKEDIMAELESVIEQKLIDQLVYGDSQWTYRADLKTEEDLWNNFRYILEQNNKDRLNGEPLSDTEFEQVKNQLQFSSFYKAGEWLVGENGKVMVHVQRDTERLHLVVMNHEHIAGGSSVYEVINQYRALADEESQTKAQDRRFDVTLMINGLPMIHIELKNKQHSYMDGFWQIKKYIGEGKFTGIFSAVQMFVISNGVDTKYFSAASDTELNPKFISGWLDNENNPVSDYLDFAKSVLRIPEAHEMIARYTVLDEEAKRLILLRPYQIHAIEAIREASKTGKSGFVWHTTGSGKTLTSYKATRNLLMDIPSIDKAIFLIDRKDLDTQTSMAFQAYANNDLVDVDETDNVFDLKKKLKSDDRQMIVTTIQKLQRLITKKLAEGTPEYN